MSDRIVLLFGVGSVIAFPIIVALYAAVFVF